MKLARIYRVPVPKSICSISFARLGVVTRCLHLLALVVFFPVFSFWHWWYWWNKEKPRSTCHKPLFHLGLHNCKACNSWAIYSWLQHCVLNAEQKVEPSWQIYCLLMSVPVLKMNVSAGLNKDSMNMWEETSHWSYSRSCCCALEPILWCFNNMEGDFPGPFGKNNCVHLSTDGNPAPFHHVDEEKKYEASPQPFAMALCMFEVQN